MNDPDPSVSAYPATRVSAFSVGALKIDNSRQFLDKILKMIMKPFR